MTTDATPRVPWTIETTPDGIEIVYGSAGYDTTHGYRLVTGGNAQVWTAKAPAAKVAKALGDGWAPVRAYTAFRRRLWVVHRDAGGGFLTSGGYTTARNRRRAEHFTHTYESHRGIVSYRVNSRGMTGYRADYGTTWCCTCGRGGFGDDRDRQSARDRAARHCADPTAYPGMPWGETTVAELRAERAI